MKLSAKTNYAFRALLELVLHWPQDIPLQISSIASRQKIPLKFLTQILLELKQLGLVESVRGQKGGYLLVKAPQEISLRQVIQHFEKSYFSLRSRKQKKEANILASIMDEVEEQARGALDRITFDDIAARERNLKTVPMFTI